MSGNSKTHSGGAGLYQYLRFIYKESQLNSPKYKHLRKNTEKQLWRQSEKHIYDAFEFFKKRLINKDIFVITKTEKIQLRVTKSNVPHLFGIKYDLGNDRLWKDAINRKLIESKIQIKDDGTTLLKFSAMRALIELFTGTSRLVRDAKYNQLIIDRGIRTGKQLLVLGLLNSNGVYVPNTALDLKNKQFENGEEILAIYTIDRKTGLPDVLKFSPNFDFSKISGE